MTLPKPTTSREPGTTERVAQWRCIYEWFDHDAKLWHRKDCTVAVDPIYSRDEQMEGVLQCASRKFGVSKSLIRAGYISHVTRKAKA